MAVVSKIVLRASDVSGREGAETYTLDILGAVRDALVDFPKVSLDLTPAELEEAEEVITDAIDNMISDLSHAESPVKAIFDAVRNRAAAGANTSGGVTRTTTGDVDAKAVRAWARSVGRHVEDRGRVPADLVAAYRAANGVKVTNLDSAPPAESWDESTTDAHVVDGPTDADLALIDAEDNASV